MAYELFQKKNIRIDTPAITIVPDGTIAVNAAAVRILVAAGVRSVLLLWDKENCMLAIKAADKKDKNSFVVSIVRNSSGKLRVKAFMNHIGWNAQQRETLPTTWNSREKMFEVTLPMEHLTGQKSD
jgi:hypothetical protein